MLESCLQEMGDKKVLPCPGVPQGYIWFQSQAEMNNILLETAIKWQKNLAKLCSSSSVLLKVELASSEIGYLAEAITKKWRRKWQHTPVFLPGESQGWGRLVGCHLWGRTESDRIEAT